jgi:hypothetical protein
MKEIEECTEADGLAREILANGPPFSEREVNILIKAAGKLVDDKHDLDFHRDGHRWSDSVLDLYADHIMNYPYRYKKEATAVDPSIDPNELHIGPMAQDIEKVNPACIKEDENGIKSVDTGRLALMNSGAIADLAREIKELKK